jgi:hypothetical protein
VGSLITVHLTAEAHYDAEPAAVLEMLTDVDFQEQLLTRTGALARQVEVTRDSAGCLVRTVRELPAHGVPEPFRALVGRTVRMLQSVRWTSAAPGTYSAEILVSLDGVPVSLTGTIRLRPYGVAGAVEELTGELRAKIPILGGRVERSIEPLLRSGLRAEESLGHDWLAART